MFGECRFCTSNSCFDFDAKPRKVDHDSIITAVMQTLAVTITLWIMLITPGLLNMLPPLLTANHSWYTMSGVAFSLTVKPACAQISAQCLLNTYPFL